MEESHSQEDIDKNEGWIIPANVSITMAVHHFAWRLGAPFAIKEECGPLYSTIIARPKGKYLFEFGIDNGRCKLGVYDITDGLSRVATPSIPIRLCDDGEGAKK